MKKPVETFSSICFPDSSDDFSHPRDVNLSTRSALLEAYHRELEKCSPRETWPGDAHQKSAPYPILASAAHQRQLSDLNEALVPAITDLVERWWSDVDACFPERMPIDPLEEKLLKWMDSLPPDVLAPYRTRQGSWRPDFLLESSDNFEAIENYRICEINARFFSNGFLFTAFGQRALLNMGIEKYGLSGATDPEKVGYSMLQRLSYKINVSYKRNVFNAVQVIVGLNSLVEPSLPLHVAKGKEYGFDINMWTPYLEKKMGMDVKIIPPEDLRLVPAAAPGGYKLYCLSTPDSKQIQTTNDAGECLEEINQLGIELHQHELHAMSYEMLQQISLRCFNDFRTVFLVHDKRMLGLVLEELDSLIARKVISSRQADILNKGIVPTYLPGSFKLEKLLSACHTNTLLKGKYLLKPVRSGKGKGILFGDQLSQEEWLSILQNMRDPNLRVGKTTYVVQKQVEQRRYDVLLEEDGNVGNYPLVGTFHITNGTFLGLGLWRSGPGRICALSRGGAWMCTVVQQQRRRNHNVLLKTSFCRKDLLWI